MKQNHFMKIYVKKKKEIIKPDVSMTQFNKKLISKVE